VPEIDRKKLLTAVELVLPAITKKEVVAQSNLLGIRGGSLVSYNDEISFCHDFRELKMLDEVALDGALLHDRLSRLKSDAVTVDVADNRLRVRSGRSTAYLNTVALEMPLAEIEAGSDEMPLPENFRERLRTVAAVCATDTSRPRLTCVNVGRGWLEGSDGYRLLRMSCEGVPQFLIPAASAARVADCDVDRILVTQRNEWVHFATPAGTTVSCRTYAADYPDLSVSYDMGDSTAFELPRMDEELDRLQAFSKRSKRIDEQVQVELRRKQVVLRAEHENGAAEETIRWQHDDVEATFSIHPDFFRLALGQGTRCQLDDRRIKFSGEGWEHVVSLR
jgi:DNA polymerase III sliding clamp (beta) subunit (PCNA family)